MDDLNETTGAAAGAPAAAPVADTATTETTPAETAAPVTEQEANAAPETGAEQTETTDVVDAAPAIPEEIQAQLSEFESERSAWGPTWEIRDLARDATKTFLMDDSVAALGALEKVSPTKTFELVHTILEANAAKHVADAHGISSRELAARLGPPEEIQMSRAMERVIEAMPDEELAAEIRTAFQQNEQLRRRLADAQGVAKEAKGEIVQYHEQQAVGQFVNDFANWQGQMLSELVEDVPEKAVASVLKVTREDFRSDPAAIKAVEAYSAAVLRGEHPRVIKATFLPAVHDALRNVMKAELVEVRGFKPKAATATPAKAPAAGTKPAAKLIGVTPGKGAPAATTNPATAPAAKPAESRRDATLRIAADMAREREERAARNQGAQAASQ